jgi:hypothetical protein
MLKCINATIFWSTDEVVQLIAIRSVLDIRFQLPLLMQNIFPSVEVFISNLTIL